MNHSIIKFIIFLYRFYYMQNKTIWSGQNIKMYLKESLQNQYSVKTVAINSSNPSYWISRRFEFECIIWMFTTSDDIFKPPGVINETVLYFGAILSMPKVVVLHGEK